MLLRTFLPGLVLAALFIIQPSAGQTVSVPIGDTLPLSGSAPGADTIYLYLTGPNLPPNGVKLDDISVPVITGVPSTFVQVPVSADDTWEYSWNTRTQGGVLDAGIYTVYAVTSPTGRLDLTGRDSYAIITVQLTPPTLTAGFGGSLTIISEPSGGRVRVDGVTEGTTPLELTNVTAGEYTVEITKEGYVPATVNTTVQEGENTTVMQTLVPESTPVPSISVGTPPSASVPMTAVPTASISFPFPALILAVIVGLLMWRSRRI